MQRIASVVPLLLTVLVLVLASATSPSARTWYITPDGSGDAPTIQAGVDSAVAGDLVELSSGVFFEHDIHLKSEVDVRSSSLEPALTTIDAQGQGRVFHAYSVACSLAGFTVTNARAEWGAGIDIRQGSIVIERCKFVSNHAEGGNGSNYGGGISAWDATVRCSGCRFTLNSAVWGGGAVHSFWDAPVLFEHCVFALNEAGSKGGAFQGGGDGEEHIFRNCTFVRNRARPSEGAAIAIWAPNTVTLERCIIAFSAQGMAVNCRGDNPPTVTCCNVFGNAGGDWVNCLEELGGIHENLSEWPRFCDPEAGNFYLSADSPCLNRPGCGEFIGALGQGCGPVALTLKTWARVKAMYR